MKESTLATKIMIGVLCAGVLIYLGLYLLTGFQSGLTTTTAYTYSVNQGAEAVGGAPQPFMPAAGEQA